MVLMLVSKMDGVNDFGDDASRSNDFARKIWGDRPLLSAGGYTADNAAQWAEDHPNDVIVFGRWFIANVSCFS